MGILITLLIRTLAVIGASYLLPGVDVDRWQTAIVVAIILAILNTILRPILLILTLPVNLLTLGLFTFIINGFIILVVDEVIGTGFEVDGILSAILFSIVLTVINWILDAIFNNDNR